MSRLLSDEQIALWRADNRPWTADSQVEKDYLLDRLLVEIRNDSVLSEHLVFGGGTCLHKVHSPVPARFSEDLDFVIADPNEYQRCRYRIGGAILSLAKREGVYLQLRQMRKSQYAGHRFTYTDCDGDLNQVKIDLARKPVLAESAEIVPYTVSCDWFDASLELPCEPVSVIAATRVAAVGGRRQPRDMFDLHYVRHELGVSIDEIAAEMERADLPPLWTAHNATATLESHWENDRYRDDLRQMLTDSPLDYDENDLFESAREIVTAVGAAIGREITKTQRRKQERAARKQREAEQ